MTSTTKSTNTTITRGGPCSQWTVTHVRFEDVKVEELKYFKLTSDHPTVREMYYRANSSAAYTDGKRTELCRTWDKDKALAQVIMKAPSTADALKNDQTTKQLTKILTRNGFGGFVLININQEDWLNKHNLSQDCPTFVSWGYSVRRLKKNWKY